MAALVVNDGTLWTVDYKDGVTRQRAELADEALLLVDCEHTARIRAEHHKYRIKYLHIYTRTAFTRMLRNYASSTGLMLERTFGFALKRPGRA